MDRREFLKQMIVGGVALTVGTKLPSQQVKSEEETESTSLLKDQTRDGCITDVLYVSKFPSLFGNDGAYIATRRKGEEKYRSPTAASTKSSAKRMVKAVNARLAAGVGTLTPLSVGWYWHRFPSRFVE